MTYFPIDPSNPRDALGRSIQPDDYVIYFTGDSSSVTGTIARIVRINDKPNTGTYTLTLEPIYSRDGWFSYSTKEVLDGRFVDFQYDYNLRDPQGNATKIPTYPGVKYVFDPDAKRGTITLKRVQNVIKVCADEAGIIEDRNITENLMRTEGYR